MGLCHFSMDSFKLLEVVEKVLETEFATPYDASCDDIGMGELIEEADAQVEKLRTDVLRYDTQHREVEFKPCKNPKDIADRIELILSERHKVRYVPRAYAYKVLFIMYVLCRVKPPVRRSWWEKKFLEEVPDYLNSTNYFKGTNPKWRMDAIIDQLTSPARLPLDLDPILPVQTPTYPSIAPTYVQQNYLIVINPKIENMENTQCQQFFAPNNNPQFKTA